MHFSSCLQLQALDKTIFFIWQIWIFLCTVWVLYSCSVFEFRMDFPLGLILKTCVIYREPLINCCPVCGETLEVPDKLNHMIHLSLCFDEGTGKQVMTGGFLTDKQANYGWECCDIMFERDDESLLSVLWLWLICFCHTKINLYL